VTEGREEIHASVRARFSTIATTPDREEKFPVGRESARNLGYDSAEIDRLPASVTRSFAGVGNPLCLGEIRPGETVLDLGSGAGLDCLLAAAKAGPGGSVVGVDLTEEMVEQARRNAMALGVGNVEFLCGDVENLPLADSVAHVAISNGVFNLCPDKSRALAETARVLRCGGRLLLADILLEDRVTPEEVARLGTWSD